MAYSTQYDGNNSCAVPQRILVAEDNQTTQDLLQLLLTQRGHHVDVASDGEVALNALRENPYDVVLLDFHLPKMDGLQVAAAYRSNKAQGNNPRFVAITADMKGLLGHADDCENFDRVMAKPFNLEDVCSVIEGQATEVSVEELSGKNFAKVQKIEAKPETLPAPIQQLGYKFLSWPEDFKADVPHAGNNGGSFDNIDAILVREPATVLELAVLWTTKTLHTFPVIDLTGALGSRSDLDASRLGIGQTDEVGQLIEEFHHRRSQLHCDLINAESLSDKLMARIFVSGGALPLFYEPGNPNFVCFNMVYDYIELDREASKLTKAGLLASKFFDRFHVCGSCGSTRLNVREECSSCQSPNLRDEPYLHHFKCAYQGPESDFRQGDDLICPKCRQELSHFSVDYDKPGSMTICNSCSSATSEPAIGFACMDCGMHATGDVIQTRDVHTYTLTERGRAYATEGRALLEDRSRALRLAEMPLELIVSVNAEIKKFEALGDPFTLLEITYQNEGEILYAHRPQQFRQARKQFLENLHNVLPDDSFVVEGKAFDVALLKGFDAAEAHSREDEIRSQASTGIELDLGICIHAYGPEDFQ